MAILGKIFDNFESYVCRLLLAFFVVLLFFQIFARNVFGYSFSWTEELSTYLFVWFTYFGASYAAKLAAHNRVTFQFKKFSRRTVYYIEAFADLFWIGFNVYFVYLSCDFVFNKMNLFWKSQTLGIPMKYIYMILPLAFTLMTVRIIQVNYNRIVRGIDVRDPDEIQMEKILDDSAKAP